jgi:hypothetical protein
MVCRRLIGLVLFGCFDLAGSASFVVTQATSTQAVLQETGTSGACTIAISTDPTFTSPVTIPDFNGTEYSGASTDTGRYDTITKSDGSLLVTVGHMNADRALRAGTAYYGSVSGCATASFSFTTALPTTGSSTSWPVPFNSAKYGNQDWPVTPATLLSQTAFIDPQTGVPIFEASQPTYMTWRNGGNNTSTPSSAQIPFSNIAGGTGWSNATTAVSGIASTATTTNTNPLDIYPNPAYEWNINASLNDVGVIPFLGATNVTGSNGSATICIFVHPATGCPAGTGVTVAAAGASIAQVLSGSSDPDQPYPVSFPTAFFSGWQGSGYVFFGINQRALSGTLSCTTISSTSTCVIDSSSFGAKSHFDPGIISGDKIYILGASACTYNMCTAAGTPNSANSITLVENVGTVASGTPYTAYQWGIRISKVNTTGTLTVGAAYKTAGSINTGSPNAGVIEAANLPYTTGDGKAGYFSVVQNSNTGQAYMVFLANDGTSRELWGLKTPASTYFTSTLGWNSNDIPNSPCCELVLSTGFHHDPTHSNVWYYYGLNTAGNYDLYKLTYATGQLSSGNSWGYTLPPPYSDNHVLIAPSDNWTWSLVVQNSNSLAQIVASAGTVAANYNANSAVYGTTGGSWAFLGMEGDGVTAVFQNEYSCGQGCPAWIMYLNTSTLTVENMIHTLDGTGSNGNIRFGGNHNNTPRPDFSTPTITSANDALGVNYPSHPYAGPYEVPVQQICRGFSGGVCNNWSFDTSLDFPIGSGVGGTAGTAVPCPASQPFSTGFQCILIRTVVGGVCSVGAGSAEASAFPCPAITGTSAASWPCTGSNCSQFTQLQVGDVMDDASTIGSAGENMRVNKILTGVTGYWDVYLQRGAQINYCCPKSAPPAGSFNCVNSNAQFQHPMGWLGLMLPTRLNGCENQTAIIQGSQQTGQSFYEEGVSSAHGDLVPGLTPSTSTWISGEFALPSAPFASNWAIPPPDASRTFPLSPPTFAGNPLPIGNGSIQSYTSVPPGATSTPWALDANSLNNNGGGNGQENISPLGCSNTVTSTATANVYVVTPCTTSGMSNALYKQSPPLGYSGRFVWLDVSSATTSVSGPVSGLSAAYTFCYAYNANECYYGSTVGQFYANVPAEYSIGGCANGQSWANIPCIIEGWTGAGGFRQFGWDTADVQGVNSRNLGYFFGAPGVAYPYAGFVALSNSIAYASPQIAAGWGPISWYAILPPWVTDSQNRTAPQGFQIQVPAAVASYARVQFGYSRYIGAAGAPSSFYCSTRKEACNTNGSPYSFASETTSGTACSSGCTITVPAMSPNLVYWQIETSNSPSSGWAAFGDVNVSAVR